MLKKESREYLRKGRELLSTATGMIRKGAVLLWNGCTKVAGGLWAILSGIATVLAAFALYSIGLLTGGVSGALDRQHEDFTEWQEQEAAAEDAEDWLKTRPR